jgi:hypothetical protein
VLVDEDTGEEFEASKDAFLRAMGAFGDEELDPQIAPLLGRLDRLVYRESGQPFFVEDMTHSGKTASNAEKE